LSVTGGLRCIVSRPIGKLIGALKSRFASGGLHQRLPTIER
jgi:hypothetical protein